MFRFFTEVLCGTQHSILERVHLQNGSFATHKLRNLGIQNWYRKHPSIVFAIY